MTKEAKFFRKQAEKAERMSHATSDEQTSQNLAIPGLAYRRQADALKKSKKKFGKKGAEGEGEMRGRITQPWTPSDDEQLRELASSLTISKRMKRSPQSIRNRAMLLKIVLAKVQGSFRE